MPSSLTVGVYVCVFVRELGSVLAMYFPLSTVCSPTQAGVYNTVDVPFEVLSEGLVVMVTNSNVKHSIACGPEGKSAYAMCKDNCEEAAKKLKKRSLREATGQDLDG